MSEQTNENDSNHCIKISIIKLVSSLVTIKKVKGCESMRVSKQKKLTKVSSKIKVHHSNEFTMKGKEKNLPLVKRIDLNCDLKYEP